MKNKVSQLSYGIKNIDRSKLYQQRTNWRKRFSQLLFLKVCELLLLGQSKKRIVMYTLVCTSLLCISRGKKTKQIRFMKSKFYFLHVDIWFGVTKCKFILKNSSLKCWLCSHLFLWQTQK